MNCFLSSTISFGLKIEFKFKVVFGLADEGSTDFETGRVETGSIFGTTDFVFSCG
jgi:hypothetical protein